MASYAQNVETLRRCQQSYDSREPPEYWDDDDDEGEEPDDVDDAE